MGGHNQVLFQSHPIADMSSLGPVTMKAPILALSEFQLRLSTDQESCVMLREFELPRGLELYSLYRLFKKK